MPALADASPAKQGRRIREPMSIISPAQLIAADPDHVLLTLPDLYDEVREAIPNSTDAQRSNPGCSGGRSDRRIGQCFAVRQERHRYPPRGQ